MRRWFACDAEYGSGFGWEVHVHGGPWKGFGRRFWLKGLWMAAVHKALVDRLAARLEERYGERLDEIAEDILDVMAERRRARRDLTEREEALWRKIEDLLGGLEE